MGIESLWRSYLDKRKSRPVEAYDPNEYDELRLPTYASFFGGTATNVVLEPIPTPPFTVGVHIFDPALMPTIFEPGRLHNQIGSRKTRGRDRTWTTLATVGMSNERMVLPPGVATDHARTELLFYLSREAVVANPDLAHFCGDLLLHYAKHPFLEGTILAHGQIVRVCALGQGQVRFLDNDAIGGLLLLSPPRHFPESALPDLLRLGGDPVRFLVLVPITHAEMSFAGIVGVENLLETCPQLPFIYDGPRPSLI